MTIGMSRNTTHSTDVGTPHFFMGRFYSASLDGFKASFVDKRTIGEPGQWGQVPPPIRAGPAYLACLDTGMDFTGDRSSAC